MSFFSEILKTVGLSELALSGGYNVVNYNGKCVYFEGIKRLLHLDEHEVKIEAKDCLITACGENLTLFEMSDSIIIKGEIRSMEFIPFDKTKKETSSDGK
jgi:hypothetical protein